MSSSITLTLFSTPTCRHCITLKQTLSSLNLSYTLLDLEQYPEKRGALASLGAPVSVPQLFVHNTLVPHGSSGFHALLESLSEDGSAPTADALPSALLAALLGSQSAADKAVQTTSLSPLLLLPITIPTSPSPSFSLTTSSKIAALISSVTSVPLPPPFPPTLSLSLSDVYLRLDSAGPRALFPASALVLAVRASLASTLIPFLPPSGPEADEAVSALCREVLCRGLVLLSGVQEESDKHPPPVYSIPEFKPSSSSAVLLLTLASSVPRGVQNYVLNDNILRPPPQVPPPTIPTELCHPLLDYLRRELSCLKRDFADDAVGGRVDYVAMDGGGGDGGEGGPRRRAVDFEIAASLLARVELAGMKDEPGLFKSFCINLYNIMVQHSMKRFGIPLSSYSRYRYFDVVSYRFRDAGLLSLTDVESGILRGNRPAPYHLSPPFPPPSSSSLGVPTLPLDCRVHFALNCGAVSCPPVSFYGPGPAQLDAELDESTRAFLGGGAKVVRRGEGAAVITLSTIMYWYKRDFGETHEEILAFVERYAGDETRVALKEARERGERVVVKYEAYCWDTDAKRIKTFVYDGGWKCVVV